MALPGLDLPGLGLELGSVPPPGGEAASSATRTENLPPQSEWRFEAAGASVYNIKLTNGHAELFGSELALNVLYNLAGHNGSIFAWQGCTMEIAGEAESEYCAQETDYALEWLNTHGLLEELREQPGDGPRVLVVGPNNTGKSSLVQCLAAWGVRMKHQPSVINLDPREGLLCPPSGLTLATIATPPDPEHGFGISPIACPTLVPVQTPLVYSFPFQSIASNTEFYKSLLTRMALSMTSKMEENRKVKHGGFIIDTPGELNDPKGNYQVISHIVSEFSINAILSIGSERLYNDLNRKFGAATTVLKLSRPGGVVDRDAAHMKLLRRKQTIEYFFGSKRDDQVLSPHTHAMTFGEITIYRAKSQTQQSRGYTTNNDFDDYEPQSPASAAGLEVIEPSVGLTGSLIAVKLCPAASGEVSVRDSAVMGFLYVDDVDMEKKLIKFLSPHPQRWGDRALLWGDGPEVVADLHTSLL
ncbi:hypothetical protein K470DRAFT_214187 [Piedraia hortae CBS 480.64]|uniref:Polynucleotide 5'-hydroxyl-kinase GRC3 n=1 Tax=Piedraia hortae CBS 480.64 TaxID=1314780 RepID=A0A6A7C313_9PEZI|nr:hypothetical protein K470DRAFT_214187 [Piedraia hortae CBS 480.64]